MVDTPQVRIDVREEAFKRVCRPPPESRSPQKTPSPTRTVDTQTSVGVPTAPFEAIGAANVELDRA